MTYRSKHFGYKKGVMDTKKLKEYRTEKGITQTFVAGKLKITRQALVLKEAGKSKFTAKELQQLCKIYQIEDIQDIDLN